MLMDFTEIVKRGFPILTWSKNYNVDKAISDLVAGITIGLTLIPQSIAYASLAGLGPEFGLYSSLCGGIIYVAFGTIPELNIAPTALLSLLTFSFTNNVSFGNINAAVLLCFLSGIIALLCGGLHLGFLVDFVSTPVVAAFTSAGALTIASSQVKNLLGLRFSASSFTDIWSNVFYHITEIKQWDAILGISCCIVLLLMRQLKHFGSPPLDDKVNKKTRVSTIKKLIWFCSVARNAFVVIICATIAYVLSVEDMTPFSLTSRVPQGLPDFIIPFEELRIGNQTVTFFDMVKEVRMGILVIPFVAILGNVAIAKAFARGKVVDASQEMIAVGMCNLIGSFFGSYPVNASFSRAAVSNASGVKTPLAGIYTGVMVILALTFLTPYFSFIPKATLAAVIICAVIFMVEVTLTKMIWEINIAVTNNVNQSQSMVKLAIKDLLTFEIDLVPFFITLIFCLWLSIEIGILIGVGVDILFLLYGAARPKVLIENTTSQSGVNYIKVTPTSAILFPSAEYIREKIMQSREEKKGIYSKLIVFECQRINKIDFTAAKCLSAFISDFEKMDKRIIFYCPKKSVAKIIKKVTHDTGKIAETEVELHEILKEPICHNQLTTVSEDVEISIDNKENTSSSQL